MDIHEIKVLLAVNIGNEELVLKNAGGKKLADSNDYFVVTSDGSCYLFDANGIEKDISAITTLTENIVSKDIKKIIIPDGVTSIGNYAFCYCRGLTSVTIPDSVTSIGGWAFHACYGLTRVTIPNSVTSIENYAFFDCISLMSVTIGNSVMRIDSEAFFSCCNLKSLIFKGKTLEEVKSMENYPFGIKDKSLITCIDEMHAAA